MVTLLCPSLLSAEPGKKQTRSLFSLENKAELRQGLRERVELVAKCWQQAGGVFFSFFSLSSRPSSFLTSLPHPFIPLLLLDFLIDVCSMVTTLETVVMNRIETHPVRHPYFCPGNCWIVDIVSFSFLLLLLHPPFHATTTLWPIVYIFVQRVSWIFCSSLGTDVCAWLWATSVDRSQ